MGERFILLFRGKGTKPAKDVKLIQAEPRVIILDDSLPRMLLVQAPKAALAGMMAKLPNWACTPERTYGLPPDPSTKIRIKEPIDKSED
jgi:hypothetical protein